MSSVISIVEAQRLILRTYNEFLNLLREHRHVESGFAGSVVMQLPEIERILGTPGFERELFEGLGSEGHKDLLLQCSELADIYELSTRDRLAGASVGNELDAITGAARRVPGNSETNAQQPTQEEPLEQFVTIVRSLVGVPYHMRYEATREGMDCSGVIIYALRDMGYEITRLTAAEMASGTTRWITVTLGDTMPESTPGVLNFYNINTPEIDHVNVGVGQHGNESVRQIVDATSNDWMVRYRPIERDGQYIAPGDKQVNQTFEPFSSRRRPFSQGTINFGILESYHRPPSQEAE